MLYRGRIQNLFEFVFNYLKAIKIDLHNHILSTTFLIERKQKHNYHRTLLAARDDFSPQKCYFTLQISANKS